MPKIVLRPLSILLVFALVADTAPAGALQRISFSPLGTFPAAVFFQQALNLSGAEFQKSDISRPVAYQTAEKTARQIGQGHFAGEKSGAGAWVVLEEEVPALEPEILPPLRSASVVRSTKLQEMGLVRMAPHESLFNVSFPPDTTFGFEGEFYIKKQLGIADDQEFTPQERDQFIARLDMTLPAGWKLQRLGENSYEVKTRVYYNTPEEHAAFKHDLVAVQRRLPGGFLSLHMHAGRDGLIAGRGPDGSLQIDEGRLNRLTKTYEAMWRALAGLKFTKPQTLMLQLPDAQALRTDAGAGQPNVIINHNKGNMEKRDPTLEIKIVTGLLNAQGHLEIDNVEDRIWWAFTLLNVVAETEERMPLAVMGLPVLAGERPSEPQMTRFLEIVFCNDPIGEAYARDTFVDLLDEPPGLDGMQLSGKKREIREVYLSAGLGEVYRLHEAHDGYDRDIVKHLLDFRVLWRIARDIVRARVSDQEALGYFPAEMHVALERALKQARATVRPVPLPRPIPTHLKDFIRPAGVDAIRRFTPPTREDMDARHVEAIARVIRRRAAVSRRAFQSDVERWERDRLNSLLDHMMRRGADVPSPIVDSKSRATPSFPGAPINSIISKLFTASPEIELGSSVIEEAVRKALAHFPFSKYFESPGRQALVVRRSSATWLAGRDAVQNREETLVRVFRTADGAWRRPSWNQPATLDDEMMPRREREYRYLVSPTSLGLTREEGEGLWIQEYFASSFEFPRFFSRFSALSFALSHVDGDAAVVAAGAFEIYRAASQAYRQARVAGWNSESSRRRARVANMRTHERYNARHRFDGNALTSDLEGLPADSWPAIRVWKWISMSWRIVASVRTRKRLESALRAISPAVLEAVQRQGVILASRKRGDGGGSITTVDVMTSVGDIKELGVQQRWIDDAPSVADYQRSLHALTPGSVPQLYYSERSKALFPMTGTLREQEISVMEFVVGPSLYDEFSKLYGGPVTQPDFVRIKMVLEESARVVALWHRAGYTHGDFGLGHIRLRHGAPVIIDFDMTQHSALDRAIVADIPLLFNHLETFGKTIFTSEQLRELKTSVMSAYREKYLNPALEQMVFSREIYGTSVLGRRPEWAAGIYPEAFAQGDALEELIAHANGVLSRDGIPARLEKVDGKYELIAGSEKSNLIPRHSEEGAPRPLHADSPSALFAALAASQAFVLSVRQWALQWLRESGEQIAQRRSRRRLNPSA